MDAATEIRSRRRIEPMSVLCIAITAASLLGAAWLRFGSQPAFRPVTIGTPAPLLQVLDVDTSEPMILVGHRGKVVWLVFWSVDSPSGSSSLSALEEIWKKLKVHRRFSLVAAAVETDRSDRVRALTTASGVTLPIYLASPETRRRFGALQADPSLHVLIDAQGQIAAIARGYGRATIDRIASQVKRLLDELDAIGETRFAALSSRYSEPN